MVPDKTQRDAAAATAIIEHQLQRNSASSLLRRRLLLCRIRSEQFEAADQLLDALRPDTSVIESEPATAAELLLLETLLKLARGDRPKGVATLDSARELIRSAGLVGNPHLRLLVKEAESAIPGHSNSG